MPKMTTTIASVAATTLLLAGAALAQQTQLTQADFERCHRQAMQVAGVWTESPAASPGVTAPHGTVTQPGPTTTPPATSPGPAPGVSGTGAGTEPTRSGGLGVGPQSGTGPGSYGAGGGPTGDRAMQIERAVQAYRDCLMAAR